jgi:hypothetical protein
VRAYSADRAWSEDEQDEDGFMYVSARFVPLQRSGNSKRPAVPPHVLGPCRS